MCFTVNVNLIKEELENRYGATLIDPDKYRPSYYYHAFSKPVLPVICSGSADRISLFNWGLIPSWVRTISDAEEIRLKTFNARSDSLEKKPSFSASFKTRRCIVPVKGFYEWQHSGKEKHPWYIYNSDGGILSLAGLYDVWIDPANETELKTFTIITTEANAMMSEIHNSALRMPAVLDSESEKLWLDLTVEGKEALGLLKPAAENVLKAHTISPLINDRTKNRNTPSVISPYTYHKDNLLF